MVKGSEKVLKRSKKNTEGKVTPEGHGKEFVKIDHPHLSMHIQFVFLSLFL